VDKLTKSENAKSSTSDRKLLLIIIAILIPFVAVDILTNWNLEKTLICLLLTFVFYFPGLIYALILIDREG
jgi:uncharacterized membrane protein YqaE (UPF0057 family)